MTIKTRDNPPIHHLRANDTPGLAQAVASSTAPTLSKRMVRNAPLLYALAYVSDQVRTKVTRKAAKDLVLALVECAKNIILGNVRLTITQLSALGRHKENIRKLARAKTSLKEKRAIIQTGGFISLLLKPLLGLLGGVLGGAQR